MSVNSVGSVSKMNLGNLEKVGEPQNGRQIYEAKAANGTGFRIDIDAKDSFEFENSYKNFQSAINNIDDTKLAENSAKYDKKSKNLLLASFGVSIATALTPAILMFAKMKTAWKYPLGILAGIAGGAVGFLTPLIIGTKRIQSQVNNDVPEIAATMNFQNSIKKLNAKVTPILPSQPETTPQQA